MNLKLYEFDVLETELTKLPPAHRLLDNQGKSLIDLP